VESRASRPLSHAKKVEFINNWQRSSYDEYIIGNEFGEHNPTYLFIICWKYMPERDYLYNNLFTKALINSKIRR
jgi:hypothetical protein